MNFVVGLLLLAGGVGVALGTFWPAAHQLWVETGPRWEAEIFKAFDRTQVFLQGESQGSWIIMLALLVLLLLAILFLFTIFAQSGGKTRSAVQTQLPGLNGPDDGGSITFTSRFVDEFVQRELLEEANITSLTTSHWKVKGDTALLLKVKVARGASPATVCATVDEVTQKLDRLMGRPVPLQIHLQQGNAITETLSNTAAAPRVL
ncbi:hypothetical protein BM477_01255 [Boudabousia marimammalium]|uniref:Uncharacterized protein n=1 Tax=Boudabousia marimammalium TaxID=156892 RepID=A0A1Q5PT41_9ACTO|nr:hypothetical protein BM477_01255 [Boudabousia marimammalium]